MKKTFLIALAIILILPSMIYATPNLDAEVVTYEVPVELYHYYEKDKLSMGNNGLIHTAKVVEKDGAATYTIYGKKMIFMKLEGQMTNVFIYESESKRTEAVMKDFVDKEYTKSFTFTRDTLKENEIKIAVWVDAMDALSTEKGKEVVPGTGEQKAKLIFDWENAKVVSTDDSNNSSDEEPKIDTSKMSSWAKEEVVKAIENNLVPSDLQDDYKSDITREEFASLAAMMIKEVAKKDIDKLLEEKEGKSIEKILEENKFVDTEDKNVIAVKVLGIINGVGENKFNPNGKITRQEAATMLTRTAVYLGKVNEEENLSFVDESKISSWAKKSVAFVNKLGVMKGVGDNKFDPKGSYTRQQAYMSIYRLYQSFSE